LAIDPRKVLPTKINLIRLKREYSMLKKIRRVLEEKREVILHYIRSAADEYNRYQREVFTSINEVFTRYYLGIAEEGFDRVEAYFESVPEALRVKVGTRVVFAVKTPSFRLIEKSVPSIQVPFDASPHLVSSLMELRKALPSILKMAEYEETIRRLIKELANTQRLINAMDYVILPGYEWAIKYIKSVLEERMREDFVRLKMLKRKLEERASATEGVAQRG